ncbi:MAG: hypothetical protein M1484_04705 [Patescibacteria group bacterium]|nr:hypothetical protein [Patescibacteria group bacterium]
MFEQFRRYAPIPELAGRRAAPPMEKAPCHALFGRKEKESRKILFFTNTFLRKTTGDIFPRHGRGFAQTRKEF